MRPAIVVAAVVILVVAAGLVGQVLPPSVGAKVDFAEYGAAARVLRSGGDMYDPRSLLEHQLPAGMVGERPGTAKAMPDAQMMWNPPWVTPLVLPLAWVGWGPGFAAWVMAQFLAVLISVALMWSSFGGPRRLLPLALVLALAFPPLLYLLRFGQSSGFMLLGLAGFLAALKANRPLLAGLALALTAVKPHLLFTFAALVAADALIRPGRRRAVAVGVLVLGVCALTPVLLRPGVWQEYVAATKMPSDDFHVAPADWDPPILAGEFAKLVGGSMAAKFAPSVVATLVWLGIWWRGRRDWDWAGRLPAVVLTCLLTTGYGAWLFDLTLLLVPLVWVGARLANAGGRAALYFGNAYLIGCAFLLAAPVVPLSVTPVIALYTLAAWAVTRPVARPAGPGELEPGESVRAPRATGTPPSAPPTSPRVRSSPARQS